MTDDCEMNKLILFVLVLMDKPVRLTRTFLVVYRFREIIMNHVSQQLIGDKYE
jgi:hypothetical protein